MHEILYPTVLEIKNTYFRMPSTVVLHRRLSVKHYENTLNILPPKMTIFQIKKNSDIFHISAQNINCGYSLEPPH